MNEKKNKNIVYLYNYTDEKMLKPKSKKKKNVVFN